MASVFPLFKVMEDNTPKMVTNYLLFYVNIKLKNDTFNLFCTSD